MGSKQGVTKVAAKRLGVSFHEYIAKRRSGLKWCTKCKSWKPIADFSKDSTRGDGRASKCKNCHYTRLTPGPSKVERLNKKTIGLAWCRGCKQWLAIENIRGGACRLCINTEARKRYRTNRIHRLKRRQHSHSRKRGVDPIPPEAQEFLLELFGGKCAYCGGLAETWDHIFPVKKGGQTTPGNVVPACKSCNSSKKAKDVFEWLDAKCLNPHPALFDRIILSECGLYG